MSEMTIYVFQPFRTSGKGGRIVPGDPVQVPSQRSAERAVANLAGGIAGGIAFSRTGDPASGEWQDAVVLAQNGTVPTEFTEASLPW